MVIIRMIEDSRFGAYLVALRENEDAARALGVNTTVGVRVLGRRQQALGPSAFCLRAFHRRAAGDDAMGSPIVRAVVDSVEVVPGIGGNRIADWGQIVASVRTHDSEKLRTHS